MKTDIDNVICFINYKILIDFKLSLFRFLVYKILIVIVIIEKYDKFDITEYTIFSLYRLSEK